MSDMNFLVIDDDEVFSGILARGLTRRGYTVAEAHNAEEAIKLANQQKFGQIRCANCSRTRGCWC
jgi:two-component system response regulator RegA